MAIASVINSLARALNILALRICPPASHCFATAERRSDAFCIPSLNPTDLASLKPLARAFVWLSSIQLYFLESDFHSVSRSQTFRVIDKPLAIGILAPLRISLLLHNFPPLNRINYISVINNHCHLLPKTPSRNSSQRNQRLGVPNPLHPDSSLLCGPLACARQRSNQLSYLRSPCSFLPKAQLEQFPAQPLAK